MSPAGYGYSYSTLVESMGPPRERVSTERSHKQSVPSSGNYETYTMRRLSMDRRYRQLAASQRYRAATCRAQCPKSSGWPVSRNIAKKPSRHEKEMDAARGTSSEWLRRLSGGTRPVYLPEHTPSSRRGSKPKKSLDQDRQEPRISISSFRTRATAGSEMSEQGGTCTGRFRKSKKANGAWNCFGAH